MFAFFSSAAKKNSSTEEDRRVWLSSMAYNYLSLETGSAKAYLPISELISIIKEHNIRKSKSIVVGDIAITLKEFLRDDGKKTSPYPEAILAQVITVSREFLAQLKDNTNSRVALRIAKKTKNCPVPVSAGAVSAAALMPVPEERDTVADDESVQSDVSGVSKGSVANTIASSDSSISAAPVRKKKVIDMQANEKANIEGKAKLSKALDKVLSSYRKCVLDSLSEFLDDSNKEENQRAIIIGLIRELLEDALLNSYSIGTLEVVNNYLLKFDPSNQEFIGLEKNIQDCLVAAGDKALSDGSRNYTLAEKIKCSMLLAITFSEKPRYLLPLTYTNQLAESDKIFGESLKRVSEEKLQQLMNAVLTPRCIAYINTISDIPTDMNVEPALRYSLICELLVSTTCYFKRIDDIIAEVVAGNTHIGNLFSQIRSIDKLPSKVNSQDKKDFMLCFSYVINELPRFLLNTDQLSAKEIMKIASEHVSFSKTLRKFGDRIKVVDLMAAITETNENESPDKKANSTPMAMKSGY